MFQKKKDGTTKVVLKPYAVRLGLASACSRSSTIRENFWRWAWTSGVTPPVGEVDVGTGDRPGAGHFPDGRAALEPRRQAPRRHARRARPPARAARDHDRLRHPRPGRGDDVMDAGGGDARQHGAAGRQSPDALPGADEPLRRGLHRLPLGEPRRSRGLRRGRRLRRVPRPAQRRAATGRPQLRHR